MADKLTRAMVEKVKRAKNGRFFVVLKSGRTRFVSAEDAKRLRAGGPAPAQKPDKGRRGVDAREQKRAARRRTRHLTDWL